jgi:hypothetical protein
MPTYAIAGSERRFDRSARVPDARAGTFAGCPQRVGRRDKLRVERKSAKLQELRESRRGDSNPGPLHYERPICRAIVVVTGVLVRLSAVRAGSELLTSGHISGHAIAHRPAALGRCMVRSRLVPAAAAMQDCGALAHEEFCNVRVKQVSPQPAAERLPFVQLAALELAEVAVGSAGGAGRCLTNGLPRSTRFVASLHGGGGRLLVTNGRARGVGVRASRCGSSPRRSEARPLRQGPHRFILPIRRGLDRSSRPARRVYSGARP